MVIVKRGRFTHTLGILLISDKSEQALIAVWYKSNFWQKKYLLVGVINLTILAIKISGIFLKLS